MEIQTIKKLRIDPGKLAMAREEKGLSQADVARELGIKRQQVWQFEKGVGLSLSNFTRLMFFYEKPIEYFLTTGPAER